MPLCPHTIDTCATPLGPPPDHLPSPGQDPDLVLFRPSPHPLPTQLTPPVPLSFRATRNQALICQTDSQGSAKVSNELLGCHNPGEQNYRHF